MHFSIGTEAQRKWLQRENEKYNLGFFNPEYYVRDTETNKADIVSGNSFQFWVHTSFNLDFLNAFYEQNSGSKIGMPVIELHKLYVTPYDAYVTAESAAKKWPGYAWHIPGKDTR